MKNVLIEICFTIFIIASIIFVSKLNILKENKIFTNDTNSITKNDNTSNTEQAQIPSNKIFGNYYAKANEKLQEMTLDQKIGQLFLVRFPESNAQEIIKKYHFAGYLLFEKDFRGKTEEEVKNMINKLQEVSSIPLLIAVDEEGGTVVRVSSNKNLSQEKFKSPMELYQLGGFEKIKEDVIIKSKVLSNLGINLNLAPVVDVSISAEDYMYKRTLGMGTEETSIYAKTVINASKGTNVSYTLKHFPGYGNNIDTHNGSAIDIRSYEDIMKSDLPPFRAGIEAGAEAVLISHNIVTSIDENNPASLSPKINNLLRNELKFNGIIITDDLYMGAISNNEESTVKAILAKNNLIIITDYEISIMEVKQALREGRISKELIDELVLEVIAWKYYKGLM